MIMSKFKDLFLIVEGGHFSDREIKKENKKKVRGKDMTKFFVKKPYFVLVTVIIVLVIGFVSLGADRSFAENGTPIHGCDYNGSGCFSGKGGK